MTSIPSFDAFQREIAAIVELPLDAVTPDAILTVDLDFDSMSMVELLAFLAEYGAERVPSDEDWSRLTVSDVYTEFVATLGR